MRAYNEWRAAELLRRQAIERFGRFSPEARTARHITNYWWGMWTLGGQRVVAPPAEVIHDRLVDAMSAMRKHKNLTGEDR